MAFKDYVEAAEKLVTENPLNYKWIGFISSEDQDVIDDAGNLTRIDTGPSDPALQMLPACRGTAFAIASPLCLTMLVADSASCYVSACCLLSTRSDLQCVLSWAIKSRQRALRMALQARVQTTAGWCTRQQFSGRTAAPCSSWPSSGARRS